jgi:rhodanese-related sulfurtransferase/predicted metal-dependent enzyme (double-stranded beta helix superfamily)
MAVMDQRRAAITAAVDEVRGIVERMGVTRAALDAIKPVLVALGQRTDLFPREHFTIPPGRANAIYHLAEDPDGSFALYGSAGLPGAAQPPHDHTTWAVIAGIYGEEHNVFFDRVDDRSVHGRGELRKTHEITVRRGSACALLPEEFHTIEGRGAEPKLHLHIYGRTLEDLPGRIGFEGTLGGTYRRFLAKPEIVSPLVTASELREMLGDGRELALLDVREEGVFAKGHLLTAASLPLSQLELRLERAVPRRSTRIVLCDDDEHLAQRSAAAMRRFGYRDIAVLKGGIGAWKGAGFELFSGVHVPSKAFGEFVEHECNTPRIGAADLKARLDAGEDIVILDSRPMGEYRVMNIPGAADCPGAELVYRVHEVVKRPETLVIVNCAGRTRSIIGAQSLINAGLPNKVMALKNGTMGWHLAGLALEHGNIRHAPAPGVEALERSRAAAEKVAQRFGVIRIDSLEFEALKADATRTLYCFDVRSPEEYREGHRAGFASAPGGQLVQGTDLYAPVRNARIVLADTDGVRATMTASWLLQMGWKEVYVIDYTATTGALEPGDAAPQVLGLESAMVEEIEPAALEPLLASGATTVVDFATSLEYRDGHVPGAWFAIRSRLRDALGRIGAVQRLVFTSPDGVIAKLAAIDAAGLTEAPVAVLRRGTDAWKGAGRPLERGLTRLAAEADDVYYKPYDRQAQIEQAMQDYLDWEVALVEQMKRESYLAFRC